MTAPSRDVRMKFTGDDRGLLQVIRQVERELRGLRREVKEGSAVIGENREEMGGLTETYRRFEQQGTKAAQNVGRGVINMEAQTASGFRKIGSGVTNLVTHMAGLDAASGRVVEGFLLLGVGSAAVTGLAAGLALAGVLYRALTKDLRAAREEADNLTESLERSANARKSPRTLLEEERARLSVEREPIARNLGANTALILAERSALGFSVAEIINTFTKDVQEDARRLIEIDRRIREINDSLAPGGETTEAEKRELTDRLAQMREMGRLSENDQRLLDERLTALRQERALLPETEATLARRLELDRQIAALTKEREKPRREGKSEIDHLAEIAKHRTLTADETERLYRAEARITAELAKRPSPEREAQLRAQLARAQELSSQGFRGDLAPDPSVRFQLNRDAIPPLRTIDPPQDELAAAGRQAAFERLQRDAEAFVTFIDDQASTAIFSFLDGAIRRAESLGDILRGIVDNLGGDLLRMLSSEAGEAIGELFRPSEVDLARQAGTGIPEAAAQGAALSAGASPVAAAGAQVQTAAVALGASAGPVLVAATTMSAAAAQLQAAAVTLAAIQLGTGGIGIPGFAKGGEIRGPGTGTSDSILMWGSNGEGVVTARAMQHWKAQWGADFLHDLNAMRQPLTIPQIIAREVPRFASGGEVGTPRMAAPARQGLGTLEVGLEEGLVARHLGSDAGVRATLRVARKHRNALRSALGL